MDAMKSERSDNRRKAAQSVWINIRIETFWRRRMTASFSLDTTEPVDSRHCKMTTAAAECETTAVSQAQAVAKGVL